MHPAVFSRFVTAGLLLWALGCPHSEASMAALRSFPDAEFTPLQANTPVEWSNTSIEPSKWFIRQYFSDDVRTDFQVSGLGHMQLLWYANSEGFANLEFSLGNIFASMSYEANYTLDASVDGRPALVINWATTSGGNNVFQYIVVDRGNGRADIEANFGVLEGPYDSTLRTPSALVVTAEMFLYEATLGVTVVNDVFRDGFFIENYFLAIFFSSNPSALLGTIADYIVDNAHCGSSPTSTCSTGGFPDGRWLIPSASDLFMPEPSKAFNAAYEPLGSGSDPSETPWREFPDADWVERQCGDEVSLNSTHPLVYYNYYPLLKDVDSKDYTNLPLMAYHFLTAASYQSGDLTGYLGAMFDPSNAQNCTYRAATVELDGMPAWVMEATFNGTDGAYSQQFVMANRADRNGWGDADIEVNIVYDNYTFSDDVYDFVDQEYYFDWAVEGGEDQLDGSTVYIYSSYQFGYEANAVTQQTVDRFASLNTCDAFFPSVEECVQHPAGRRRYTLGTATGQLYPGEFAFDDRSDAATLPLPFGWFAWLSAFLL